MKGILYSVGVGPGDAELLTLKAVRVIKNADVIMFPGKSEEDSVAYKIASGAVDNLREKQLVPVFMPMTKDENKLLENHKRIAFETEKILNEGKNIAFLTLGDPTVYSTCFYIHEIVKSHGFESEIIPGVTSFCACSAKLENSLAQKDELLHIIPASYSVDRLPEILSLPGNKVLMKSGKRMREVKEALKEADLSSVMVENCGMENEKVYRSLDEIPDEAGYYSLIIAKENKRKTNMKKYKCTSSICVGCCFDPCDYIYDPSEGDEDHGIKKGTSFEDLPDDWVCPNCGGGKEVFLPLDKFKKQ